MQKSTNVFLLSANETDSRMKYIKFSLLFSGLQSLMLVKNKTSCHIPEWDWNDEICPNKKIVGTCVPV